MSGIIVSDNTKGNKLHKGGGTPDGGEFTSAGNASNAESIENIKNTKTRGHLTNPYEGRDAAMIDNFEKELLEEYYDKGVMIDENVKKQIAAKAADMFWNNYYYDFALKQTMEDTGYNESQANIFLGALSDYLGSDYDEFTKGHREQQTKVIDAGLKRMPKFEGAIYRGTNFDVTDPEKAEGFKKRMNTLKPGAVISLGCAPRSFSSDRYIARDYAKAIESNFNHQQYHSIMYICDNNKSGASVNHISEYGSGEKEVTVPSTTKYRIKDVEVFDKRGNLSFSFKNMYGTKKVLVYLEEVDEND